VGNRRERDWKINVVGFNANLYLISLHANLHRSSLRGIVQIPTRCLKVLSFYRDLHSTVNF